MEIKKLFALKFGVIFLFSFFSFLMKADAIPIQSWLWAKSASAYSNKVAVDASGNSFVTGYFSDTVHFGNFTLISSGASDIFIAKYDATGTVKWAIKAGGSLDDVGRGIGLDASGNIYVAGYFSEDYSNGFTANCVFSGTTLSSAGETEIFLAKYDSTGLLKWVHSAGGQAFDYCDALSVDASGNCFITGSFGYDFYNGFGGMDATFNNITLTPVGDEDVYVAMYNEAGFLIWTEQGAGASQARAICIATDGAGSAVITGVSFGGVSFENTYFPSGYFIAKCNSLGWQWASGCESSSGYSNGNSVSIDSAGNTYAFGSTDDDAIFGLDTIFVLNGYAFIVKYNVSGVIQWIRQIGGNAGADVSENRPSSYGSIAFAGNFDDTLILANDTLISQGLSDLYLSEIDSSGNILNATREGGNNYDNCIDLVKDSWGNLHLLGTITDSTSIGPFTFNDTTQFSYLAVYGQQINVSLNENKIPLNFLYVYPNPSAQPVHISFSLPNSEFAKIRIIDVNGRLIKNIADRYFISGKNEVEWNSTNENGDLVEAGIYLLSFESKHNSTTKNISIIR